MARVMSDEQKANAKAALAEYWRKRKAGEIPAPERKPRKAKPPTKRQRRTVMTLPRTPNLTVGRQHLHPGDPLDTAKRLEIATCTALYHCGFTMTQIMAQTNLSREAIRKYIHEGQEQFRLADRVAAAMMRLQGEALPQAVENLVEQLETTNVDHLGRKDAATMATLNGLGAFRSGADTAPPAPPQVMALQVQFAAPPGMVAPVQTAQIVGSPRVIEAAPARPPEPAPVAVAYRPSVSPLPADFAD